MPNPASVSDSKGEWFELYNSSDSDIDLSSWDISDNDSDSHTISSDSSPTVPSKSYVVLCRNSEFSTNGGVTCLYQYSSFTLANSEDEIVFVNSSGSEVDRIEYTGEYPFSSGVSMELVGSEWLASTETFGDGDKGTPGEGSSEVTSSEGSGEDSSDDSDSQDQSSETDSVDISVSFDVPESIDIGESFSVTVKVDGFSESETYFAKFMAGVGDNWNDGYTLNNEGNSWLLYTSAWKDFPQLSSSGEVILTSKLSYKEGDYQVRVRVREESSGKNHDSEDKVLSVTKNESSTITPELPGDESAPPSGGAILSVSDKKIKLPNKFSATSWESTMSSQKEEDTEGEVAEEKPSVSRLIISAISVTTLSLGYFLMKKIRRA